MRQLVYALRYVLRLRWDNFAKIVSLSLGLSLGLVVFSMVSFHISYDNFLPDRNRVYQLRCSYSLNSGQNNESDMIWAPVAPAMKQDLAEVECATRMIVFGNLGYNYEGHTFSESTIIGDSSLFEVLDFGVISGDPHKALSTKGNIMVSESFARRAFGKEDPIGKILTYNNTPVSVEGIFRDIPKNSHRRFEAVLSFPYVEMFGLGSGWGGGDSYRTYIKLNKGASPEAVEAKLEEFFEKYGVGDMLREWKMSFFFVPLKSIHSGEPDVMRSNIILGVLAFMVLFIAAMNFVLLSLSSLSDRSRTIGMFRCSGASRSDIFSMLLTETTVFLVFSLAIAAGLILAFSKQIETFTGEPLSTLFAPSRLWFLGAVVLGLFLAAGIIPARAFASIPVKAAFRSSAAGKRMWKNVLLLIQFSAVSFVAVCLIIVVGQYDMFVKKDIGYNYENLLYADAPGVNGKQMEAIREELFSMPQVEEVSFASDLLLGLGGQPAFDMQTHELLFACRITWMDYRNIPLLGIKMLYGQNFTPEMGPEYAIVNRKYMEMMHWQDDPTGKLITDHPGGGRIMTIVGVTDDFMTGSLHREIEPVVIHPMEDLMQIMQGPVDAKVIIRVNGVNPETIGAVHDKLSRMLPGKNATVHAYRNTIASQYNGEKLLKNTVILISVIILAISLIGMTGYAGYEIRRRRREIAIRKVHGARSSDILFAVSKGILAITLAAIAIGAAGGYYAGDGWLRQFVYKIPLSWWIFAAAGMFVLSVVCLTVYIRTRHLINENPIENLKSE